MGSIPGQTTKIPHALTWPKKKSPKVTYSMTSFIEHSQNNQVIEMDTRGVRRRFLHRLGVGATIKGQEHGGLCDDGGHLYLDCSDGYMNLHMTK